jgi:hypothetical protein
MPSSLRCFALALALAGVFGAAAARPAQAGFPFTAESYADPCIVVCPAGDGIFTVAAKRNGTWSGDPVWIDFCDCAGVHFAPLDGTEGYVISDCTVAGTPQPDGLMKFPFKAGGVCSNANIVISIFIPDNFVRTSVASPDQNGDFVVSATDLTIAQPKLGTGDPTGDLNCDGLVTQADLDILQAHLGHRWDGATPAHAPTWGRLKIIYR